ncbi:hypothetical protein HT746_22195 [Burkholderia pyrrocinia]|uniref:hypothetical protein n=1 Tax=Burkholderia pyrrocinia TaxID=60550 RepID=UPI0015773FEA|nr:hypothetical protein [Burkholderia pyrrocinia]NTX29799.1 hypothetical protein [Burkholderia pyrrocinia]
MKNTFKNAWHGEERLWKVWWLIGVPLNLLFIPLLVLIMGPAYPAPLRLAAFIIYIVPFCAWMRCAWMCAPNVEKHIWTILARAVIVYRIGSLGYALFNLN